MFFDWFSTLPSWITGAAAGSTYLISRWIFLRALGVIYLIAFVSLWVQIKGLVGSRGIAPMQEYLGALRNQLGFERFYSVPTVFWLNAGDTALHIVCALGVLCALALIIGFAPMPSLVLLWLLYLSIFSVGRDFLSFQWDTLLLEVGFAAILVAPANMFPGLARETAVSPLAMLLLWWLLFRFMFESGIVKLSFEDKNWWNFTALDYHYWTQPLPTWTAWYMAQLPAWFHKFSVLFMYLAEIVLPFFIFTVRPLRIVASLGMIALQVAIGATGNYNFFNLLSIALCVLLFDDALWISVLPASFVAWLGVPGVLSAVPSPLTIIIAAFAALSLCIGSMQLMESVFPRWRAPLIAQVVMNWIAPFRSLNDYGLFRVMTTKRPEIIVEGSDDGRLWLPYEFKWKPGDLHRRPAFVEPHQPRLDWQMWFAALGSFRSTDWFQNFLVRLLQGSPDVLALLKSNPFPDRPPKYVRAEIYEYRFTTPEERSESGGWWKRELKGLYAPALSLQ